MKKFTFILALVLISFIENSVTAHEVSIVDLLKTLNNFNDLRLTVYSI